QPAALSPGVGDDIGRAVDVQLPGHGGVEFTRLQRTVARAIQHRRKAIGAEEILHAVRVLGIQGDEADALELPGLPGPNADDLTRIALLEIVQSVIASDAGDAGDQQGQAGIRDPVYGTRALAG